jgi:RNA polymerase sigma factor (sigma-70 family)
MGRPGSYDEAGRQVQTSMCPFQPESALSSGGFPSTHWSIVLAAAGGTTPDAREALEQLCRKYWYPLYAYVRRQGHLPEDAQDLTQEFFARFLEKRYLALADPHRGRFRSFLLTCLKHFLANEWDRATAAKRGGGRAVIPLDAESAENRYLAELTDDLTPERAYDQRWAVALLEHVLARLGYEYVTAGKGAQFEVLRAFLWGAQDSVSYADVAAQLHATQGTVKTAVRRLRARYQEVLRSEIAHTVATPEEVEEEIRWLFAAFA